jgi:hypothetical protein
MVPPTPKRMAWRVTEAPWRGQWEQGGAIRGWEGGGTSRGWGGGRSRWGKGSSGGWDGGGWGPCSSPGTERKCEKDTACVPDAQRPERGMEPVKRLGCRVCWLFQIYGLGSPAYLKQPPAVQHTAAIWHASYFSIPATWNNEFNYYMLCAGL